MTVDLDRMRSCIADSSKTLLSLQEQAEDIAAVCRLVVDTLSAGGKVLTAGNGGSAAEALHMAEELIGRFRTNRAPLPAVCLAADTTALTCIGNDFGFDSIFSRQVAGLGRPGDLLVLFSTSGKGRNLEEALRAARAAGVKVAAILGRDGGALAGQCDAEVVVSHSATERIQEAHQLVLHLVLDAVEQSFPPAGG